VAGPAHGFVDEFSLTGQFEERVASHDSLNSPWGLAIAPQGFGNFGGDLLVGNFGDGTIDVFDPTNDHFLGQLRGSDGKPIVIDGLWTLRPGSSTGPNNDPNAIYFTAGLNGEQDGLFGKLTASSDQSEASVSTASASSSSAPTSSASSASPSTASVSTDVSTAPRMANLMQATASPSTASVSTDVSMAQSMANLVQSAASFGASTMAARGVDSSPVSQTVSSDPAILAANPQMLGAR
jgi:hypothetical protein